MDATATTMATTMATPPVAAPLANAPLRHFQREMLELARERNVVMVGDTGIGKTHVAIALLNEQDYSNGRRAFFMAPTRQLVMQITAKIRGVSTLPTRAYCGRELDLWDAAQWQHELRTTRVLVCTPEIVNNALHKGYIQMDLINLMVFDECHHVTKRHPYAQLMQMYDATNQQTMPRLFGTTSCPTHHCAERLHAEMKKIELSSSEKTTFAAVAPMVFELHLSRHTESAENGMEGLSEEDKDWLGRHNIGSELLPVYITVIREMKDALVLPVYEKLLKKCHTYDETKIRKKLSTFVLSCVSILDNFGLWCLYRFIEIEIQRVADKLNPLLAMPGTMYGIDRDALKTILIVGGKRRTCSLSCTPKVDKIVQLVQSTLFESEPEAVFSDESDDYSDTSSSQSDDVLATGEASVGDDKDNTAEDQSGASKPADRVLQGIIFVSKRVECRILTEFLNKKFETGANQEDDGEDVMDLSKPALFGCVLGQAGATDSASFGLPSIQDTLKHFGNGTTRVIVSTSVSAEGVDFPMCSLVIISDKVPSARTLLQLRGRARHEDGVVYYLAQHGDVGHHVHFRIMLDEISRIQKLDFSCDKKEGIFSKPLTVAVEELQGYTFIPSTSKIEIPSTGASLTLDNCIKTLNEFCQTLPPALFTFDAKNMFTYTQEIICKRPLFKCKLVLPPELEMEPFECSPMQSKTIAKKAVAFDACEALLEKGFLDASLTSIYRKGKSKAILDPNNISSFSQMIFNSK